MPSEYVDSPSDVTYSSILLSVEINPYGQETSYSFLYGTTSGYGSQTPLASAGNGTGKITVSQIIAGLQPGTTYHYRVVLSNDSGSVRGVDHTVTTKAIPLSVQIAGVPNPVVFGSSLTIEGALSGTDAADHEILLQADPFPYTAGFRTLGNPEVTTATGAFSFPVVSVLQNTQLRVQTVGGSMVSSPIVLEKVAVGVTFHAQRTRRQGLYRFYGTVTPSEVGALVGFQLLKPGQKSVNEGGTVVTTGSSTVSRFSRRVRIRHPGVYRILIEVSNDGAHASNYSEPIFIH